MLSFYWFLLIKNDTSYWFVFALFYFGQKYILSYLRYLPTYLFFYFQEYLHFNRVVLLPVKLILQSGLDQKLGKLGNLVIGNFFLRVFLIQVFSFYCRTKYRKWKNFEHYFRNSRVLTCHLIFQIKKINILK